MTVRQATVSGNIHAFREGDVNFGVGDLVDFLAQGDPRQHRDVPGHDILTLDQQTGMRLRWLGSAPNRTAVLGEPPVDFNAAVKHVGQHESLLAHAASLGTLVSQRHTTFVVEGDPYYPFPVTYSVVDFIPGQPLAHGDSKKNIRAADAAKLIQLGHAWIDILTDPQRPPGASWHEDAVLPRQVNGDFVLFDGDPRLTPHRNFPLRAIAKWVGRMNRTPEQQALLARAKAAVRQS